MNPLIITLFDAEMISNNMDLIYLALTLNQYLMRRVINLFP